MTSDDDMRYRTRLASLAMLCPVCQEEHVVELTDPQFMRYRMWKGGEGTLESLLPDLSPADMMSLRTGLCKGCNKRRGGR